MSVAQPISTTPATTSKKTIFAAIRHSTTALLASIFNTKDPQQGLKLASDKITLDTIKTINELRTHYFIYSILCFIVAIIAVSFNPFGLFSTFFDIASLFGSIILVFSICFGITLYIQRNNKGDANITISLFMKQKVIMYLLIVWFFIFNVVIRNPFGVYKKYALVITLLLLVGLASIGSLLFYNKETKTGANFAFYFLQLIFKYLVILFVVVLFLSFVIPLFNLPSLYTINNIIYTGITIIAIMIAFSVLRKIHQANSSATSSSGLTDTLLSVPCFLLDAYDTIFDGITTSNDVMFTGLIAFLVIVIIIGFFLKRYIERKYYYEGGELLVEQPIFLNRQTECPVPQNSFPVVGKQDYNFAISCWFLINSENEMNNTTYPILNFNDNPLIEYNTMTNTFTVSVFDASDTDYLKCIGGGGGASTISSGSGSGSSGSSGSGSGSGSSGSSGSGSGTGSSSLSSRWEDRVGPGGTPATSNTTPVYLPPPPSSQHDNPDDSKYGPGGRGKQESFTTIIEGLTSNTERDKIAEQCKAANKRVIYSNSAIKLQRWNHLVINSSSTDMDIFINNELVNNTSFNKPIINNKIDSIIKVGGIDGMNGNICNLLYFDLMIDVNTIDILYKSVKDLRPPVYDTTNEILKIYNIYK